MHIKRVLFKYIYRAVPLCQGCGQGKKYEKTLRDIIDTMKQFNWYCLFGEYFPTSAQNTATVTTQKAKILLMFHAPKTIDTYTKNYRNFIRRIAGLNGPSCACANHITWLVLWSKLRLSASRKVFFVFIYVCTYINVSYFSHQPTNQVEKAEKC